MPFAKLMRSVGRDVPFGNGWSMLRSWSHHILDGDEKSVHRGIKTEQSHSLYAASQSAQVRAREYCADEVVSHAI